MICGLAQVWVIFRNVLNNWFTKERPAEAVCERVMVKRSEQHLLQKYYSRSSISHSCVYLIAWDGSQNVSDL